MKKSITTLTVFILLLLVFCQPKSLTAHTDPNFVQDDWSGGSSSSTINFDQFFEWNKFYSISDLDYDVMPGYLSIAAGKDSGYVISNPFNQQNHVISGCYDMTYGTNCLGRSASSVAGLSSQSWRTIRTNPLTSTYGQYKLTLTRPSDHTEGVYIRGASRAVTGYVYDKTTKAKLRIPYTVSEAEGDKFTYDPGNGMMSPGYYAVTGMYHKGDHLYFTITASASGYKKQTKVVSTPYTVDSNANSGSYAGSYNFYLEKSSGTPSTGSGISVTEISAASASKEGKPNTPVLTKLVVGGNEFTGEKMSGGNQFRYSDGITFSGKTIANGIIHLYFSSDPYETETVANKNGVWEYTLDRYLGEGEHTLSIAAEDPKTKKISEKSKPLSFSLISEEGFSENKEGQSDAVDNLSFLPWYLTGGVLVVLGGAFAGGWFYLKKKKVLKVKASDTFKAKN